VLDLEQSQKMDAVLLNKSLLLVSGKGGVGKTAVSSALAFRARKLGRKVVLFCCDAPSLLRPYPEGRAFSSTLQEVLPGLWGVNQPTEEAVHAYLSEAIHSKKVVDLMFRNKVARAFLQVAPSVGDLAMMGRIYQIARQFEAKHQGLVIVDMPATGHALSMLQSPDAIANILTAGPIYERAKEVSQYFKNSNKTLFSAVTWPEELPITEVLELIEGVQKTGVKIGPIILNGVVSNPLPSVSLATWEQIRHTHYFQKHQRWIDYLQAWSKRVVRERARLQEELSERFSDAYPVFDLPFISTVKPSSSLGIDLACEGMG
jgi:arsenite-transporting ATPase